MRVERSGLGEPLGWDEGWPVLSRRKNGDTLYGSSPGAEQLYRLGTPPVHALRGPDSRVGGLRFGSTLLVVRDARGWAVFDEVGVVGRTSWTLGMDGMEDRRGFVIRLPSRGVLHVAALLVSSERVVVNVGGHVVPD